MRTKKVKPKKCPECKQYFTPYISTLQKHCSVKCAADKARRDTAKERKKESDAVLNGMRERLKKHGDYEGDLEGQTRAICRLIDASQPCVACGKFGKMAAGHRFSVGHNNTLRYCLDNLHICCFQCNDRKSGNLDGYDEGLRNIYGKEYWEHVYFGLKRTYPIIKLSIPELKEKTVIAKQIVKELKKLNLVYPPKMRIELRKTYNERIGIYL